jgi:hypothetical protein
MDRFDESSVRDAIRQAAESGQIPPLTSFAAPSRRKRPYTLIASVSVVAVAAVVVAIVSANVVGTRHSQAAGSSSQANDVPVSGPSTCPLPIINSTSTAPIGADGVPVIDAAVGSSGSTGVKLSTNAAIYINQLTLIVAAPGTRPGVYASQGAAAKASNVHSSMLAKNQVSTRKITDVALAGQMTSVSYSGLAAGTYPVIADVTSSISADCTSPQAPTSAAQTDSSQLVAEIQVQ